MVALILIAALLLGSAFRIDSMCHKHGLHIDEGWSYVTAAGHLAGWGRVDGRTLEGRWVPVAQWRSMAGPGRTFDFGQIISGLGHHDVHPPLYFSVLHVWVLIFGVRFWTGPSLNLLIDILTGAALFGFARRLLRDPVAAALVVLVWSVSPAVRMSSSMARMYSLEALFCVLFLWLVVQTTDRQRPPSRPRLTAVLLALATAAGMLTQYQFLFVVVGGLVFVVLMLGRSDRRRCSRALLSMAVGLVLVVLVEPWVFAQFRRQSDKRLWPLSKSLLHDKITDTVGTFLNFFGLDKPWLRPAVDRSLPFWVLLAVAVCIAGLLALALPRSRRWLARRDWTGGWLALVFLVWIAGTIIAQNLAFLSQPRILSARYLAVAWPLLAFVPVLVSRALLPRRPFVLAAVFCLAVTVPLSLAPVNIAASSGPLPKLASAHRVVIDVPAPGALPLVLWYPPKDALAYADNSADLRARPAAWLDQLSSGDVFVHRTNGEPDALGQLRRKFTIIKLLPSFRLDVYRVTSSAGEWRFASAVHRRS